MKQLTATRLSFAPLPTSSSSSLSSSAISLLTHNAGASSCGRVTTLLMSSSSSSLHQQHQRSFHVTSPSRVDMEVALNQVFAFHPTPETYEPAKLLAKAEQVPADIDFELQLSLYRTALSQHKKQDAARLVRDMARGRPAVRAVILSRVERYTKQLDNETAKANQAAHMATPAGKLGVAPSTVDTTTTTAAPSPQDKNKTSSAAATSSTPKMPFQEALLHGQLPPKELAGILRNLYRETTLTSDDEKQLTDEARVLWEAGTAAVLAVDHALPKHFCRLVIDAFPWADLLLADDVAKLIIENPLAKAAGRIRAQEVLKRQEEVRKRMSWLSRLIIPTIAPAKVKRGQTPHVYDAALDAVLYNEFEALLNAPSGEKLTQETFRHVIQNIEESSEKLSATITGIVHETFVEVVLGRSAMVGIDYFNVQTPPGSAAAAAAAAASTSASSTSTSSSPPARGKPAFCRTLLEPMKSLKPYFAQARRLDASTPRSTS